METIDEQVLWKLPKSLLIEIEKLFLEQKDAQERVTGYKCVKKGNYYYCEKWVDGAKITRGPYRNCPANCD